jgi:hypothetical protein
MIKININYVLLNMVIYFIMTIDRDDTLWNLKKIINY